jgi:hypothetical protein
MKKLNFKILLGVLFFSAVFFACAAHKSGISLTQMKGLIKEHSLVVAYQDGTVKTYDDNGIKPLFKHLENGNFKNTYVFDKVTGKASALVLAYGGATNLYTGILSKEAIPVLEKYNIKYNADKIVDYIYNNTGNDKCPMEKTVVEINTPKEAYTVLKEKFGK